MPLTKQSLAERAEEELKVLDGVIDYAERMMYQDGTRREYEPLRRQAYGKTVVIETENQGVQTFRLSSTAATYPNAASGYATPHSPVGRLCAVLQPGDEDMSPRWGDYRVREVRQFGRYQGPKFEPNVRNFQHMLVQEESARKSLPGSASRICAAWLPTVLWPVQSPMGRLWPLTSRRRTHPVMNWPPPRWRILHRHRWR